jgi:integrase-like protein
MKYYGELANIPASKRHFHALKHSIATHLLDAGTNLRFVHDWIGHAWIKNTVIYAQLTSRRCDEEARKVFTSLYVVWEYDLPVPSLICSTNRGSVGQRKERHDILDMSTE